MTASQLFATAHTKAAPVENIGVCSSFRYEMTLHIITLFNTNILCNNTEKNLTIRVTGQTQANRQINYNVIFLQLVVLPKMLP